MELSWDTSRSPLTVALRWVVTWSHTARQAPHSLCKQGCLCLSNLHPRTGCSCSHMTLPGRLRGAAVNCLAVSGLQGCSALLGSTGEGPIDLGYFRGLSNPVHPLRTQYNGRPSKFLLLSFWSGWLPHGGRRQTGGWRIRKLTESWMELGALHPFGWSAAPSTGQKAVG